jgi:four helix bundle protein
MKENIVLQKSFDFTLRVLKMYKWFYKAHPEILPIGRQLLRSGTSIGANVEEAVGSFSRKEFASKIGIAYKEARETRYWLKLLKASDILSEKEFQSMYDDSDELVRLLGSIQKTNQQVVEKDKNRPHS